MTYKELEELIKETGCPMCGKNIDGENVIIEAGCFVGEKYFKLTTAQNNGWCRINYIFEDGSRMEEFRKK